MNLAAVFMSAVLGASAPVQFEARHEDTLTLRGGQVIRGVVLDAQSDARSIHIQVGRGARTVPRSDVIQHVPRMSIEDAHDEAASRIEPGDARSWRLLAEECLRKSPPLLDKAAEDLRKSISAHPMDEGAHELLVRVLVRKGDLDAALGAADAFGRAFPRSAKPPLAAASALIASGRDPTEKLDASIKLGASSEAQMMRARWDMERGNLDGAASALERAGELGADRDELAFARARLFLSRNDLPAAEAAYRALMTAATSERRSEAALGLGAVLLLTNKPEEADRFLATADPLDDRMTWTRALVRLALEAADPQAAERAVDAALRAGGPEAKLLAATRQYRQSRDAAAALKTAGEAKGPQAAALAGWLATLAGDLAGAEAHYARAVELRPSWAEPRRALASVAVRRGQPEAAARHYMAALDAVGPDARLLGGLALAQISAGNYADARASLELAGALDSPCAEVHLGWGYLAYIGGHHARALASYTRAAWADDDAAEVVAAAMPALAANAGLAAEFATFSEGQIPPAWQTVGRTSAAIRSGRLAFEGQGEIRRRIDAGVFRSLGASFQRPASRAGIALETRRGRIELTVNAAGMAAYRVREDAREFTEWRPVGQRPAQGAASLEIALAGNADGAASFSLRADDAEESFVTKAFFWNERTADAFLIAEASAAADNLLLLEAAREEKR